MVFSFEIDDKLKREFEKIADDNERTMAGQLRLIIEEFVSKENKK